MRYLAILFCLLFVGCVGKSEKKETLKENNNKKGDVTLMTLDPGHFHAALVQKSMYEQVNNNVYG